MKIICFAIHLCYYITEIQFPFYNIPHEKIEMLSWEIKLFLKRETDIHVNNKEGSPYLACNDINAFFTSAKPTKYHAWYCQSVCDALSFLLDNVFI